MLCFFESCQFKYTLQDVETGSSYFILPLL